MNVSTFRRIVTLPRSDRIRMIPRNDLYLAVLSVLRSVGGNVAEAVLASQFLRNLSEDSFETVLVAHHKRRSAGFVREFFQRSNVSATTVDGAAPAAIRAIWKEAANAVRNGIDGGIALVRGDKGVAEFQFAGCVLAVADQDNGLSSSLASELLFTCEIDGVVNRCAAADLQLINRTFQYFRVFCEVLHERHRTIESDHQRKIFRPQNGFQKTDCCDLLFDENRPHARTRVDEQGQRQGQFVLAREVSDFLPPAVLFNKKILCGKGGNKAPVPVGHRERNVDQFDIDLQGVLFRLTP